MDTKEIIEIFANEAERLGADANDDAGIVRSLVNAHGLGFCCAAVEVLREKRQAGLV